MWRTGEPRLDIEEPPEESLIRGVQIRRGSWVVRFNKTTWGQKIFTNTMELSLNFAFLVLF